MHLNVESSGLDEEFLQYVAAALRVGFHQQSEGECVMDVGLSYVEDSGVILGKDLGKIGCEATAVRRPDILIWISSVVFIFSFLIFDDLLRVAVFFLGTNLRTTGSFTP